MPGAWLTPNDIGQVLGALECGILKGNKKLISLMQKKRIKAKKINYFFNKIIGAKKEEYEKLYVSNTTNNIFLTLLYLKAETKQDVLDFIDGLHVYLDDLHIGKKSRETFLESSYTNTDSEIYLDEMKYQTMKYNPFRSSLENILSQDPETNIYEAIRRLHSPILPPKIDSKYCNYKDKTSIPTCTENTLHDFLNILLYNKKKESFDSKMLPKKITLHPKLIEFYKKYTKADDIKKSSQAWMNLVSGHNELGISYIQKNYEIRAHFNNIFKFINYFFNTDVKNCTELNKLLSDKRRCITFTPDKDIEKFAHENKIEITIQNTNNTNNTTNFTINIRPGHGWIDRPENNTQKKITIEILVIGFFQ